MYNYFSPLGATLTGLKGAKLMATLRATILPTSPSQEKELDNGKPRIKLETPAALQLPINAIKHPGNRPLKPSATKQNMLPCRPASVGGVLIPFNLQEFQETKMELGSDTDDPNTYVGSFEYLCSTVYDTACKMSFWMKL